MDNKLFEKILKLYEMRYAQQESLEINIDHDLLKEYPIPTKVILDIINEPPISTISTLSDDQNTLKYKYTVRLCLNDSCQLLQCRNLHLCQSYILNKKCSNFEQDGKCCYAHSLSTVHNKNLLEEYGLPFNDENAFTIVSRLIRLSISPQNKSPTLSQPLNKQSNIHTMPVQLNSTKNNTESDRESCARDQQINSIEHLSNQSSNNIFTYKSVGRGRSKQQYETESVIPSLSPFLSPPNPKFYFSRRLAQLESSSNRTVSNSCHRLDSGSKEKSKEENSISYRDPSKEIDATLTRTSSSPLKSDDKTLPIDKGKGLIIYYYSKEFTDEQLVYLLGPGREHIIADEHCEILSYLTVGYCRVLSREHGQRIEQHLHSILPCPLKKDRININEEIAFFSCSSAAEYIFEQNQIHYAIVSEILQTQITIDIIHRPHVDDQQSSSTNIDNSPQGNTTNGGSLYISETNASIDVVVGDIAQIPVDLMVCAQTSYNLIENILCSAGPDVASKYRRDSHPNDALVYNGGLTQAKKILFVPWQSEIRQQDLVDAKDSLRELVKWSIEKAHSMKLNSISFPPIGSGGLGLEIFFVAQTMIDAACESLEKYKVNVTFVIYPSAYALSNQNNECYEIFRIYLDSIVERRLAAPTKGLTNNNNNNNSYPAMIDIDKQSIKRNVPGKQLFILSNLKEIDAHHDLLVKSLENLIHEEIFDLSLVEPTFVDKIDSLVDVCLNYYIIPRIDFVKNQLTLRGDRDSCVQCLANLRKDKEICQYRYKFLQNAEKSQENQLNSFVSLKIDEARAIGLANISISDDNQTIYNIDLNKLQIKVNDNNQLGELVQEKIKIETEFGKLSSRFPSPLLINTLQITESSYKSLEFYKLFEKAMPKSSWQIERIDAIENYPLCVHFMSREKQRKSLFFHACPYSSVQSILHYGLHSSNAQNYGKRFPDRSICLTRNILDSHLYGSQRSTNGNYYLFVFETMINSEHRDFILISNDESYYILPTYLIVYKRLPDLS